MRQLKEVILGVIVIIVFGWVITYIYRHESRRSNKELAKRMTELSPRGGPPQSIEGLRQAIALYEDQIERNKREGAQTGVYWKILATRLADTPQPQHNAALEALERAIYYNTEDPVLYYLTGINAAYVAKSKVGFTDAAEREKEHYFSLAENGYKRALELDVTYTRAMYGLAILYVYELARPEDAIVYLERLLQIMPSDVSALAVLAAAHYMLENYQQAVEAYDRLIIRARDRKIKEEAQNNRDFIMELMYGRF